MAQWLSKILYSWHLGLGDLVIVQSNICPLCWEDGLVAGPVSAKPILTRILSLFWIWTPSKKGTRIMSVDYTGQSLVIGAPVGVYLVWLLGFFFITVDRGLQVTANSVRGSKTVRGVASPRPPCWWMYSGTKDLGACGSLWEILLRPLLPTGLLLSRLRAHKSCTLL